MNRSKKKLEHIGTEILPASADPFYLSMPLEDMPEFVGGYPLTSS